MRPPSSERPKLPLEIRASFALSFQFQLHHWLSWASMPERGISHRLRRVDRLRNVGFQSSDTSKPLTTMSWSFQKSANSIKTQISLAGDTKAICTVLGLNPIVLKNLLAGGIESYQIQTPELGGEICCDFLFERWIGRWETSLIVLGPRNIRTHREVELFDYLTSQLSLFRKVTSWIRQNAIEFNRFVEPYREQSLSKLVENGSALMEEMRRNRQISAVPLVRRVLVIGIRGETFLCSRLVSQVANTPMASPELVDYETLVSRVATEGNN